MELYEYPCSTLLNEAVYITPSSTSTSASKKSFQQKHQELQELTDKQLDKIILYAYDADPDIRSLALKILSRFGKTEFLVLNLFHENETVKKVICKECIYHNLVSELICLTRDNSLEVAKEAVKGLVRLGKIYELVEILEQTKNSYLRAYILDEFEFAFGR